VMKYLECKAPCAQKGALRPHVMGVLETSSSPSHCDVSDPCPHAQTQKGPPSICACSMKEHRNADLPPYSRTKELKNTSFQGGFPWSTRLL
jgi:hypothetical protein